MKPAAVEEDGGPATILLVEDGDKLRSLLADLLKLQGYAVLEAANGHEALWVCEQHGKPIHLVLTDMVMPRISGPKLVEQLISRYPEMRVIFMSGDGRGVNFDQGMAESNIGFIQKPFKPRDLMEKVRQALI